MTDDRLDDRRPMTTFTRDPWVLGGLVALGLLSVLAVALYRSAPQSLDQVGAQTWLAAAPNAAAPHLARARERLEFARGRAAAGDDAAAIEADSVAAVHAWRAGELAAGPEERAAALELWAEAVLGWATILQRQGTGAGLRPDDNEILRRALALAQRVAEAPVPAESRQRAQQIVSELERQLRPGPLEWLPTPG